MSWDRLALVTPPAVTPFDLDAAKAHLNVYHDDDNALIESLIAATVAMVDGPRGIGIAMVEQTWRLTLDGFADRAFLGDCGFAPLRRFPLAIPIPLGPVSAIASFEYTAGDGTEVVLVEGTDFKFSADVDPQIVFPPFGMAWATPICEPGAVRIEFVAGFGPTAADVPADLVAALKLTLGHLYNNREDVIGVDRQVGAVRLPLGAAAIFDRYRVGLFG